MAASAALADPPLAAPRPLNRPADTIVVTYTEWCRPQPGWKGRPRPWRRPFALIAAGNVRPESLIASVLFDLERHANQVRVHEWKDGVPVVHLAHGHRLGPPLAFVEGLTTEQVVRAVAAQPGEPDV
jgi:hypothetical protein